MAYKRPGWILPSERPFRYAYSPSQFSFTIWLVLNGGMPFSGRPFMITCGSLPSTASSATPPAAGRPGLPAARRGSARTRARATSSIPSASSRRPCCRPAPDTAPVAAAPGSLRAVISRARASTTQHERRAPSRTRCHRRHARLTDSPCGRRRPGSANTNSEPPSVVYLARSL